MKPSLARIFLGLFVIFAFLVSPLGVVQAAGEIPVFAIKEIKEGESVTVLTYDFPADRDFEVMMGKNGTRGVKGIVVATLNSGKGGTFEATVNIPAELKDEGIIAIRMESKTGGYYAYNWFVNKTGVVVPVKPVPEKPGTTKPAPDTSKPAQPVGKKAYITILDVNPDTWVKVRADNLPANQTFTIRIGTYYNFFRDYVVVGSFDSGSGGSFEWTSDLPAVTRGVRLVTVRIDSAQRAYAFNAFKNVEGGTRGGSSATTESGAAGTMCKLLNSGPSSVTLNEQFDAYWEIQNTSGVTWKTGATTLRYVSGASMHGAEKYDIPADVPNGGTLKLSVHMTAPGDAGEQTERWALLQGETNLCQLVFTVKVR